MAPGVEDEQDRIDAKRVIALLTYQRDEYRMLKSLADRQRSLVRSSEPERLLGVLAERRKHVDRLTGINEEVKRLRQRWSDVYATMGEAQRHQADGLLREVQTVLGEILASDEEDAKLLSVRMAATRQERGTLTESKRAYAAYGLVTMKANASMGHGKGQLIDQTDEQA